MHSNATTGERIAPFAHSRQRLKYKTESEDVCSRRQRFDWVDLDRTRRALKRHTKMCVCARAPILLIHLGPLGPKIMRTQLTRRTLFAHRQPKGSFVIKLASWLPDAIQPSSERGTNVVDGAHNAAPLDKRAAPRFAWPSMKARHSGGGGGSIMICLKGLHIGAYTDTRVHRRTRRETLYFSFGPTQQRARRRQAAAAAATFCMLLAAKLR